MTSKKRLPKLSLSYLERLILTSLDAHKANNLASINLTGKSDVADRMVIASGTSQRHIGALADKVVDALAKVGITPIPVEGQTESSEWVLVDAGNVIVHLFTPEARSYYNLEKMWSVELPQLEAVY